MVVRAGVEATRERVLHGLAYTGGVLLFFAGLAALLLALRAGGSAVGWGFQLQYPPFVAVMAYVFVVIGLSLSGAITVGARLMSLGGARTGIGVAGAFGTGALAALVAAPCTAPFHGGGTRAMP
jgi:thiol:disulfide interchange protein